MALRIPTSRGGDDDDLRFGGTTSNLPATPTPPPLADVIDAFKMVVPSTTTTEFLYKNEKGFNFTEGVEKMFEEDNSVFVVPELFAPREVIITNEGRLSVSVVEDILHMTLNKTFTIGLTRKLYNMISEIIKGNYNDAILYTYDDFPMYKRNPVYALLVLVHVISYYSAGNLSKRGVTKSLELIHAAFYEHQKIRLYPSIVDKIPSFIGKYGRPSPDIVKLFRKPSEDDEYDTQPTVFRGTDDIEPEDDDGVVDEETYDDDQIARVRRMVDEEERERTRQIELQAASAAELREAGFDPDELPPPYYAAEAVYGDESDDDDEADEAY
jgi:hypothetical protein